jgi:hypothetical protein
VPSFFSAAYADCWPIPWNWWWKLLGRNELDAKGGALPVQFPDDFPKFILIAFDRDDRDIQQTLQNTQIGRL